ncbi:MAG: SDR family NAD(P)-dependent oxidoreductase [Anaerolineales bacterium]|nr:SDR family NAD(P)-dependent oxidoreductase [Anaerolineales bacterium]
MAEKVYVVTGGNAGIGYEIVQTLARQQGRVVMVSRDEARGRAAQRAIHAATGGSVDLVVGDVGSVASTRRLADQLLAAYPAIHVLINNAGVWMTKKVVNEDGLEQSFMVNHLAPFMLNHLLLPALKAADPARIVDVNAGLYVNGKVDLAKTPYGKDFGRLRTYANSKLCGVLTLAEQARRLEGSGVTINMVHPGVIHTGLGDSNGVMGWLLRRIKRNWAAPDAGAVAPVWLATAPEVAGKTGLYFNEKAEMPLAAVAQDEALAADLWALSVRLAGLETRLK